MSKHSTAVPVSRFKQVTVCGWLMDSWLGLKPSTKRKRVESGQ